jgi:twitching motility protein PilT
MRLITPDLPSLNDVQLDTHLADRLLPEQGLVLITGATGSGKSSTLAALVAHRRQFLGGHTITLEDPIEFRYDEGKGRISQREIGRDSPNFASALRSALRQDPDVILLGELRDLDSARIALTAAETGHLVLSTLHTASAIGAIDRILGLFPADEQALARTQLADTLTGVISQQLVWREQSATVIREVLLATAAVRHLIREHRLNQIEHIMQTSGSLGMQTLAQAWQRAGLSP